MIGRQKKGWRDVWLEKVVRFAARLNWRCSASVLRLSRVFWSLVVSLRLPLRTTSLRSVFACY